MLPVCLRTCSLLLCSLLLLFTGIGHAQFSHPLDIQPDFSGTFGELRANHFHSGLDYKTQGKEGVPVLAAAGGWISRIKTSFTGFGKVVYMDHPEGYTSVYAHLHSFIPVLGNYLDSARREMHQNEAELFPDSARFCFRQGDTLGWSGNSGSSQGPHLHFEIRDRMTQEPLNPLQYLSHSDSIHPVIDTVILYSKHPRADAYQRTVARISAKDCISVASDTVYVEIFTHDPSGKNANGIYKASVQVNDSIVFTQQFDRFNFDETRFANAKGLSKTPSSSTATPYIMFTLPGDQSAVKTTIGSGMIVLHPGDTTLIRFSVFDFSGNCTDKSLKIHFAIDTAVRQKVDTLENALFYSWKKPLYYSYQEDTVFSLPAAALYQDTPEERPIFYSHRGGVSVLAGIMPDFPYAFHKAGKIRLPLSAKVDAKKIVLHRFDQPGDSLPAEYITGGNYDSLNYSATATIRRGSYYQFGLDTIAPEISTLREWTDPVHEERFLQLKIKDTHSGVGAIVAYMNGQWIISEYDPKSSSVLIRLQAETWCPRTLKVVVEDRCGNKTQFFHYF
jgi:hypothetical protein